MIPLSVLDLSPIKQGSNAGAALQESLALAQTAERLGYRRYWMAEHHNMPGIASAATAVALAHVAGGTRTIRVGAGGIMLQMTPESAKQGIESKSDDWDRLSLLLKTVEDLELVDTDLAPETLLWRLFNEDEVRVQPPEAVIFRCDCNADRITSVLRGYGAEDRAGLADPDGIIRARCEFCGKTHEIGPEQLA